ncbi:MAG: hypothetical protein GX434_16055 [Peptococcaceae bacterium]|nr:hypothetical protein [Peptococcaceae bacterium]
MKLTYLQTDYPNGRSHILMRNLDTVNPELHHYVLVLSSRCELWVDVFWPYDEEVEKYTYTITEQQFWRTFREWRLQGLELGDSGKVAEILAQKQLNRKKNSKKI